jgi:hypothetical protein
VNVHPVRAGIYFWPLAIYDCAFQVPSLSSVAEPEGGKIFLSIAVTLHRMNVTADGFLVFVRQRFFNQAGRRPNADSDVANSEFTLWASLSRHISPRSNMSVTSDMSPKTARPPKPNVRTRREVGRLFAMNESNSASEV